MLGVELVGQLCDSVSEGGKVFNADRLPRLGGAESLDQFQVGAHKEVVLVHRRHGLAQHRRQLRPLASEFVDVAQKVKQVEPGDEQGLAERNPAG